MRLVARAAREPEGALGQSHARAAAARGAARRRAPLPSARPAPPRARASAAGGRRGPARAGERARPGCVVQGRACACARGAGSARCVVHWCAPSTPHICDHQNACVGCYMQFDDKPSNFSGAHAATVRHCAPHRARWRLRRHRRSLAALPAGRGPPPLLVLPPLPPRDSAAWKGRAERPRRRRRPVQIARVVFSCGARWQQTRLGILNSAGEQPGAQPPVSSCLTPSQPP